MNRTFRPADALARAWAINRPLTAVALAMLPTLALCLAGLALDDRLVTGAPAWLKPAKFAASIGIFNATMIWIFSYLADWPRLTRRVGQLTSGVFAVDEVVTATAGSWSLSLTESERPSLVVEAVGHQVSTMKNCLEALAFGGQVFYFGVPDDLIHPFDMMIFLRKKLTLRSGTTMERRRVCRPLTTTLANIPNYARLT